MSGIWESAISSMESRLNPHTFTMWIKPVSCASIEGEYLVLRAPNRYIKEWFEDNYLAGILEEIRVATGQRFRARFEVSDEEIAAPEAQGTIPAPPGVETAGLVEKYTFDSFVVGPSNQLAHAAARLVGEIPGGKYNPLFLYGGVGLGKTHLIHAIGHAIRRARPDWKIVYQTTEGFLNEFLQSLKNHRPDDFRRKFRDGCDVLLMDDIQFLAGKDATQEEFFHTFNSLHESGRQIVVTADTYPHEIPHLEDRIRSRFQWGLIADIQAPELETRLAILQRKAEIDRIPLPRDVAVYLASNIKSNVRELEGLLIRLAAVSSLSQRPITIEFARDTLKAFLSQATHAVSVETIQKEVASYYGLKLADLKSPRRHQAIARPRQVAMFLSRKLVRSSYPELGQKFGGKDHTTVMSACRKIEQLLEKNPQLRHEVLEIERHLVH